MNSKGRCRGLPSNLFWSHVRLVSPARQTSDVSAQKIRRTITGGPLKTLEDQLSNYAAYHRDPRNITTHFVGIPLIVLSVMALHSRPAFTVSGLVASPAVVAAIAASLYYLRLSRGLGLLMTVLLALCVWCGAWAAQLSMAAWLALGIGGFVVGWVFQFIGHLGLVRGRGPRSRVDHAARRADRHCLSPVTCRWRGDPKTP